MADSREDLYRAIPSIEAMLEEDEFQQAAREGPRRIVVQSLREAVESLRAALAAEPIDGLDAATVGQRIRADARRRIREAVQPHYRRVINATGIILHTALARRASAEGRAANRRRVVRLFAVAGRPGNRPAQPPRPADRVAVGATHRGRGSHGGQQ